jgi:hypothetical protein
MEGPDYFKPVANKIPPQLATLMVRGNFEADRNRTKGETLLKLQKRFVGIITENGGQYHAHLRFAKCGILEVGVLGDLYWE